MIASLLPRFGLWTVLFLACLPSPSVLAQERPARDGDKIVVVEGHAFPQSIAGLVRGSTTTYQAPGYGFSVRYTSGAASWADIYLYDKEFNLAPPPKDALKGEMVQVLREILIAQERGSYENAKIETASLEKNLASARLSVTADGREHLSFAFLTIAHGKFLKIRFSTREGKAGQKRADAFRNAVFALIRKSAPVVRPQRDPRFI